MKKIACFLMLILSIFLLSSCFTENERNKFYEQMDIPMNTDYILVSNNGFVKDQKAYYYEDICAEYLYEVNIDADRYDTTDMRVTTVLFDSHIFIRFRYYSEYEYKNSHYLYMFAIYNINTLEFEFSLLSSSKGYELGISKIGNYGVIIYNDHILCIDINTKIQHTFELNNYIIESKSEKGIVLKNKIDNFYYLYDESLSLRKLEIDKEACISNIEDSYIICYYNDDKESFAYDIDTNTILSYKEYKKNKDSKELSYDVINNDEYTNIITIMINGIEHTYYMEELRIVCNEIKQVEEIFDTTVYFKHLDKINDEYFLTIGNNESFFGAYNPGCTLPMVFKIEDDFTLNYIGYLPNIHNILRHIYKK